MHTIANKRIVFIGTVDLSAHCLKVLLSCKANVVGIFAKKKSVFNADFIDLWPLAQKANIPIFDTKDINDPEAVKNIRLLSPDVIFCFGWSQLLKEEVLGIAPMGVFGIHPAALPANRGRHPLIWALALGLESSALTLFKMDKGADTGPIVGQIHFKIGYKDDATSLYRKIKSLVTVLVRRLMVDLSRNRLNFKLQNTIVGNSWRKRGMVDGQIDWRMSSRAIYNLVRALTTPYVGAHCLVNGESIKIFRIKEKVCSLKNIEPGKVLSVKGRRIVIKTYDGAVELEKHNFIILPKKGDYL